MGRFINYRVFNLVKMPIVPIRAPKWLVSTKRILITFLLIRIQIPRYMCDYSMASNLLSAGVFIWEDCGVYVIERLFLIASSPTLKA